MAARKHTTVRQIELTRALRAFKNAGLEVVRAEIDTAAGKIVIMTATAAGQQPAGAFDAWEAKRARSA